MILHKVRRRKLIWINRFEQLIERKSKERILHSTVDLFWDFPLSIYCFVYTTKSKLSYAQRLKTIKLSYITHTSEKTRFSPTAHLSKGSRMFPSPSSSARLIIKSPPTMRRYSVHSSNTSAWRMPQIGTGNTKVGYYRRRLYTYVRRMIERCYFKFSVGDRRSRIHLSSLPPSF